MKRTKSLPPPIFGDETPKMGKQKKRLFPVTGKVKFTVVDFVPANRGGSIDLCVNAPKKRLNASKCTYAQALICALSKSKGKFCYLGAVFTARSVGVTAFLPQGLRFQRTIACAYLSEPSAVSSPEESFVCSECVASSVVSEGVSDCSIGVNPTTSPTGNVKAIP